jgi:prepilin peptidase CpaA
MGEWLASGGWSSVSAVVLALLVVAAACIDVREHRIPNALVLSGIVIALLMAHLPGGSVVRALSGALAGFAMGLPLYWLRAMGAGDVKLMAMAGAFLGGADAVIACLVIFMVGGVLGLVAVARRRAFARLGENLKQIALGSGAAVGRADLDPSSRSVGVQPYGVAIAAGTILYLALAKGGILQ